MCLVSDLHVVRVEVSQFAKKSRQEVGGLDGLSHILVHWNKLMTEYSQEPGEVLYWAGNFGLAEILIDQVRVPSFKSNWSQPVTAIKFVG